MSSQFVCNDFLRKLSKFLGVSGNHTQNIKNIFNVLCCKYCWLSNTFYRTQISLIDPEKYHFLYLPVTKLGHNFHVARSFE